MPDTLPGDWTSTETAYDFQRVAWLNEATANVLVVEERREPWHDDSEGPDISVALVDAINADDPEPIRTVLEQTKDPSEALRGAFDYMRGAPGGE